MTNHRFLYAGINIGLDEIEQLEDFHPLLWSYNLGAYSKDNAPDEYTAPQAAGRMIMFESQEHAATVTENYHEQFVGDGTTVSYYGMFNTKNQPFVVAMSHANVIYQIDTSKIPEESKLEGPFEPDAKDFPGMHDVSGTCCIYTSYYQTGKIIDAYIKEDLLFDEIGFIETDPKELKDALLCEFVTRATHFADLNNDLQKIEWKLPNIECTDNFKKCLKIMYGNNGCVYKNPSEITLDSKEDVLAYGLSAMYQKNGLQPEKFEELCAVVETMFDKDGNFTITENIGKFYHLVYDIDHLPMTQQKDGSFTVDTQLHRIANENNAASDMQDENDSSDTIEVE